MNKPIKTNQQTQHLFSLQELQSPEQILFPANFKKRKKRNSDIKIIILLKEDKTNYHILEIKKTQTPLCLFLEKHKSTEYTHYTYKKFKSNNYLQAEKLLLSLLAQFPSTTETPLNTLKQWKATPFCLSHFNISKPKLKKISKKNPNLTITINDRILWNIHALEKELKNYNE